MEATPRVTLGIATYNRDTYLAEAIESCLGQDYASLEVLVVIDGSNNPRIDQIVSSYADNPRFRVVRHEHNLGIGAGYSSFISQGRGELIAMLGDDDVCMPDRISRQVAIFDEYPDTGVVHGDAIVIDADGRATAEWRSAEFNQAALLRAFYRRHNFLIDPTRIVHRRVYEQVGGYNADYRVAQDFEFWLRAVRHFRFRHCGGGPLIRLRRHGANESDESQREAETADVANTLEAAMGLYSLRELVPELDWPVLDAVDAERQALVRLADLVERRVIPVPALAAKLRARASAIPMPHPTSRNGRRLLMTMFGWNDSGGGTVLPRLIAKELTRRGWEVSVFHAATAQLKDEPPYTRREWIEDGVRLVGIYNRPTALLDVGNPRRELDDPVIRAAFRLELERFRPEIVHFHNLHNLGSSLIDEASVRGARTYFTTHNYWLVCQRAYLLYGSGEMCPGPGDGSRCATCAGSDDMPSYRRRLNDIRGRATGELTQVFAVSESVRRTLVSAGHDPAGISVVRQAMPGELEIWESIGRDRPVGRRSDQLIAAFLGLVYPSKGAELLVQAAQRTNYPVKIKIVGESLPAAAEHIKALDTRGVVELTGRYEPAELGRLLEDVDVAVLPSRWWDCAPLSATECLAARLPLVVPRLGGLPEAIRDGVDGLTFAGLDVDDLARQLDRLAGEEGLLERLQGAIEPPMAFADHVDELEAYYTGRHEPTGAERLCSDRIEVRWKGDHGSQTAESALNREVSSRLPGPVQRVDAAGRALDAPLSHAADVEVHNTWPPDLTTVTAGRVAVIVSQELHMVPKQRRAERLRGADELWVPDEAVSAAYVDDGFPADRIHVLPTDVGERLSWDAVAATYAERLAEVASRSTRAQDEPDEPFELREQVGLRVLATPAWRGDDQLAELLGEWAEQTTPQTSACLYLLADADAAGSVQAIERHITTAAERAGVDLDLCADINVLVEPFSGQRDRRLHMAVDAYVPLHAGCTGQARLARAAGNVLIVLATNQLAALIAGRPENTPG